MHYKEYKKILSPKNGMNLYRGCTHGCIYCDSRSKCYRMDHDFLDVEIKTNADIMLDRELGSKRKKVMVATGSMTDPYLHLEKELKLTQKCLEVIYKHGCGATMITKSDLILRDLGLLKKINERAKCVVQLTLTTFDDNLTHVLEPNVADTKRRAQVLEIMRDNGIPTVVWLCPILPFINDSLENLKGILDICKRAKVKGIICFGMGMTLREGNREYFYQKLDEHFPGLKQKYIQAFGNSYIISSPNEKELWNYFTAFCKENNVMYDANEIFEYLKTMPAENKDQLAFI